MKYLFPLFALVAVSGSAFAQTEPNAAPAPAADTAKPTVPSTPIFKDVPPNHWAFAAVQRIASAGIVEGYPSTAAPTTQTVAKVAPPVAAPAPVPAAKLAPRVPVKTATKAKVAPQAKTPAKKSN